MRMVPPQSQVFFYYLLDNGTQVTKVSFKPVLIFQKK